MSEEEFTEFRQASLKKRSPPFFIRERATDANIRKWNKDAEKWKLNCNSKKCFYHFHRGSYRCNAKSIQPSFLLLLILAILHVPYIIRYIANR
jgi:hypothetical protein